MKHRLIDKKYKTPLGTVNCGLTSDKSIINMIKNRTYKNGQSEIYQTFDFQIELIEFKIKTPLYNGDTLTNSKGWIWRIIKQRSNLEHLKFDCKLNDPVRDIEYDVATGEHLDAIEARNNDWVLHIGTEDGEIMNSRANKNDWFPIRLKNKIDLFQPITKMNENGLVTKLPGLRIGERLHIQYICAYDKTSIDINKVNTWLAVDKLKRELENWIGCDYE